MPLVATSQVKDKTIPNGAFYPEISTQDFAATTRLDGSVSDERLKASLTLAIIKIERELKKWADSLTDYSTLEEYDTANNSNKCKLYEFAVFNEARAEITVHHKDFDSTPHQKVSDEDIQKTVDEYRRTKQDCITMILDGFGVDDDYNGKGTAGFMTVDLI